MIDNTYRNTFKETLVIIENSDESILSKIPKSFLNFLKSNMNYNYNYKIDNNLSLDCQKTLPETKAILSLIFRNYLATSEEKFELDKKDNEYVEKMNYKNIDEIFKNHNNIDKVIINNNLMVIPKENFFKKILKKIKSIFKNNTEKF